MFGFARSKIGIFLCLILGVVFLSSCSVINSLIGEAKVRPPEVSFAGGKLSGLSFDAADFLFDLEILNPNGVGLKMSGFDYNFLIDGASFLKGQQDRGLQLAAGGKSNVQIPVSLNFLDLYKTFQNLMDQDRSKYRIDCTGSATCL